jgi:hypothetical protein
MKRPWGWGLGAGGALVTGVAALVAAGVAPIEAAHGTHAVRPRPSPSVSVRPYAADSLARATAARPVFRAGRRASAIAYDPTRSAQPVVPEARPPRPVLALVGIVAGAEPTAVIEGFPAIEGARVVRVGDVIAGLTVRRIADNQVRISGLDTVWVLQVREPWR